MKKFKELFKNDPAHPKDWNTFWLCVFISGLGVIILIALLFLINPQ